MNRYMARALVIAAVLALVETLAAQAQMSTVSAKIASAKAAKAPHSALADVVVWLVPISEEAVKNTAEPKPSTAKLLQKDKAFHPNLLVLPAGSTVDFPNKDPFFHNVFSLFNGKRFDLGLYEAGDSRTVHFDRVGVSYIFCNIHPEMSAVIITLKTPYFALSNSAGDISIAGVPAGQYELHLFAEGLSADAQRNLVRKITVDGERTSLGAINLPERALSSAHKNK